MLDPTFVRENPEAVETALRNRGMDASLEPVQAHDRRRRELLVEVEDLRRQRKEASKSIGERIKAGEDPAKAKDEVRQIGDRITTLEQELNDVEQQLTDQLSTFPNLPDESVPVGKSEEDNPVTRTWGEPRSFDFEPKAHWDLGPELGIIDFERATKLTGARFAVMMGAGARLERALIQFMLDMHTGEHGYTEVLPPFMVNGNSLYGTGQLPKFEEDLFKVHPHDFYLIPTAEVPLTNLHSDEILDVEQLPISYTAYTPCFRSEAGSYGKDVRGLIRQHQFDKVELVHFTTPEQSYEQLEKLTSHAEEVLKRLELPYRVVTLCTGDMGFGAAKTYDIEVWLPGQQAYREISSCSNCTDFQARRAKIRYRAEKGAKPRLAHTLNGSGLAVGRTLLAILENFQQADGSVVIPEALRPYMGGMERIG
ncbi:seryl-tRNA synthetase [Acidobacteria bacterium Mor1]|nr:seryl-tRNA synthetase [Acidobacteria bacterium Mor1]